MLPTLYTSNFTPDDLGEKVGTRAASRIFRNGCHQVRVQAPDYSMEQSMAQSPRGFKMVN